MPDLEPGDNSIGAVQAKLSVAIEKAKEVCERLQQQTSAAAKATDKTIREHPYQAIGVAFALGLVVGVLAGRSKGR